MKQELINELKNFFSLNKEEDLTKLAGDSKVKKISGLSRLINRLTSSESSPKEIAEQLEDVIVNISLKKQNAEPVELSLKSMLVDFQEKIQNGEIGFDEPASTYRI